MIFSSPDTIDCHFDNVSPACWRRDAKIGRACLAVQLQNMKALIQAKTCRPKHAGQNMRTFVLATMASVKILPGPMLSGIID
tara:strand:+ start:463 stop:708 length:246 start_codon:yes stop_codon:yes gene_type:complete